MNQHFRSSYRRIYSGNVTYSFLTPQNAKAAMPVGVWDPSKPLFKYVDDPSFLERGMLRIGTLRDFKSLEDERADADEFTAHGFVKDASSRDDNFKTLASNLGIPVPPPNATGSVRFINSSVSASGPSANCYCMSYDGNNQSVPSVYQHVFRIKSFARVAERIYQLHPELGMPLIAVIEYGTRIVDATKGAVRPDFTLKPKRFSDEREVRLIWPNSKNCKVIDVPADPILKNLFVYHRAPIKNR